MVILVSSASNTLLGLQLSAITEAFSKKTGAQGQISTHHLDETARFSDVRASLGSSSLFAKKQLVIVRGACSSLPMQERKQFHAFIKEGGVTETTSLVFAELEPLPAKKKDAFTDYLRSSKKVKIISVPIPSGNALTKKIRDIAQEFDVSVSEQAVQALIAYLGHDYDQLVSRVEQLALQSVGVNQKEISAELVSTLVKKPIELEIFKTTTALAQKNRKEALTRLHDHLAEGEHPLYLLAMMRYQFRTLAVLASASQQTTDPREIQQMTKLSPFVVRKGLGLVRNFNDRSFGTIFEKLVDADQAIKSGRIQGDAALDLLAVAICS